MFGIPGINQWRRRRRRRRTRRPSGGASRSSAASTSAGSTSPTTVGFLPSPTFDFSHHSIDRPMSLSFGAAVVLAWARSIRRRGRARDGERRAQVLRHVQPRQGRAQAGQSVSIAASPGSIILDANYKSPLHYRMIRHSASNIFHPRKRVTFILRISTRPLAHAVTFVHVLPPSSHLRGDEICIYSVHLLPPHLILSSLDSRFGQSLIPNVRATLDSRNSWLPCRFVHDNMTPLVCFYLISAYVDLLLRLIVR